MTETLIERRARLLGPNVPTFYRDPLHIVRGQGVWLWDQAGRRYLDGYNNVPHVGHCHPEVLAAIAGQGAVLNIHTRYLHEGLLDYLDALTALFDPALSQAIMVCTGSEANDIALRMAEAATGATGLIATDNTYHGNTRAVSQLSTRRPPIGGYPPHVRLVPAPDPAAPGDGVAFGAAVAAAIADLERAGHGFAGLILCPVFANEGLIPAVPGWLDPAVRAVRAAGGVLIADEVQPGFGRLGDHWWGHQALGVVPDVVTLGKPMGNGHPVAAVLARPAIMAAFRSAFGYFNTYGGNPVSVAAAQAVLRVMQREDLRARAADVGACLLERLGNLRHPAIGGVRGQGMLFAIDLIRDGAPDTALAEEIVERMRDRGVLIGRIGRAMNTLKIRPPLVFGRDHADLLAGTLAAVLADLPA